MRNPPTFSRSRDALEFMFFRMKTPEDVADLLEIEVALLNSLVNRRDPDRLYSKFFIPKKAGGSREISVPNLTLKLVQSKLACILQIAYVSKSVVHGFLENRSIVSNAEIHAGNRFILNVDLKNFFPSIHFGRVQGLFENWPYQRPSEVALVLARISCSPGTLPQGAPTSPIISNMICAEMDDALRRLAAANKCSYTRYADDLTFSTDEQVFPRELASLSTEGSPKLGYELVEIICDAGFVVNDRKIKLQTHETRQEVTGLVANVSPNVKREFIRQIRAMLHAWQRYGLEAAQKEFETVYYKGHRIECKGIPDYRDVVRGRIEFVGMVRGKDDPIYTRFMDELSRLDPRVRLKVAQPATVDTHKIKVWTEGKTDAKHLRAALKSFQRDKEFSDLDVLFENRDRQGGDDVLFKMVDGISRSDQPLSMPTVAIFDRDKIDVVKKVSSQDGSFKKWKSWLYSFALPVPQHRKDTPEISIEFYYTDQEIMTLSQLNRRLYISSEFNPHTARHLENKSLSCFDISKIARKNPTIIDGQVYDEHEENVALSKDDFASSVLEARGDFSTFDFSEFAKVFQVLREIIGDCEREKQIHQQQGGDWSERQLAQPG